VNRPRAAWPIAAATLVVAGCGHGGGEPGAPGAIMVTSADTACTVARTELPAGQHVFRVSNTGAKVTEFYVYGPDNRIVGEVENIAPGLSRDLTVSLPAGAYRATCKPGMAGDGIRQALTVTGTTTRASADPLLATAATGYAGYVRGQAADLLSRTRTWTAVVKSGDLEAARDAFAATRAPYERIEPVAESFADLDARIDARDTDIADGDTWSGFHRIEKDLWQSRRPDPAVADRLLADVTALHQQLAAQTFTALDLANGAKSLLDEVAAKKVTGEEDHFSHTDLSDFAANVDGSKAAIDALRPAVDRHDAALGPLIDRQFAAVGALLARHRDAGGRYAAYTTLKPAQVRELSDAINALAEPVSRVGAVTSAR
jgi:iron uptake system component EfeO